MRISLTASGLVTAYDQFLADLRKEGLPQLLAGELTVAGGGGGDIFEYAAWFLQEAHDAKRRREYAERELRFEEKK